MPFKFDCISCGHTLLVQHLDTGESAQCKNCQSTNEVPGREYYISNDEFDKLVLPSKPPISCDIARKPEIKLYGLKLARRKAIVDSWMPRAYAALILSFFLSYIDGYFALNIDLSIDDPSPFTITLWIIRLLSFGFFFFTTYLTFILTKIRGESTYSRLRQQFNLKHIIVVVLTMVLIVVLINGIKFAVELIDP